MDPSISETVRGFADTLGKGIKASIYGMLMEQHDARIALEQDMTASGSADEPMTTCSPSETCLLDEDDPGHLVCCVLAIETTPSREEGEAPDAIVVHYTWNKDGEEPVLIHSDCTVSEDAEAAIKANEYRSWPLESIKNIFDVHLKANLVISDDKVRTYGDEHVHAISILDPCNDHYRETGGACRVLRLSSKPSDWSAH